VACFTALPKNVIRSTENIVRETAAGIRAQIRTKDHPVASRRAGHYTAKEKARSQTEKRVQKHAFKHTGAPRVTEPIRS
jgi:hypothetical protein